MRLEDLIKAFLTELKFSGASPLTIEAYSFHLEKLKNFLDQRRIPFYLLNGKASKEFRNYLSSLGLKAKSINAILSACKSFYDWLLDEEKVKGNPFASKKLRVAEEKKQPDFLSDKELSKVLKAFKKLPKHIGLSFRLMLSSGLRVSEVANLTKEDLIIEKGRLFLKVRQGKGKKERLVPVVDAKVAKELLALAKNRKEGSLFKVKAKTLKNYAILIKKETGVSFHSHRLRHTFATKLLSQGVGIDVVQKVLGHASIETTRRYAETLPEKVLNLAVKVE